MRIMTVILMTIAAGVALAETSMLSTSVRSESTSDGFDSTLSQIRWQNHRRDPVWPYANEAPSGFDLAVTGDINTIMVNEGADQTFSGYAVKVTPGMKFSPAFAVHAGVGWHTVEEKETAEELEGMVYEGTMAIIPTPTSSLLLSYQDDFAYTETFHRDLSLDLRSRSYIANFSFRPAERLQVRGTGRYGRISDGNRRTGGNLALLYGIMPNDPWWWAGVVGEYLAYSEDAEAYWSPERFVSYGLYSESTFPLIGLLSGSLTGQITRSKEEDFEVGWSRMVSVGLALGKRESFELQVSYNYLKSSQEASSWSSSGLQARVSSSF